MIDFSPETDLNNQIRDKIINHFSFIKFSDRQKIIDDVLNPK